MHIRAATPDDARAIARVHVASWKRAYQDLMPAEFLDELCVEQRETQWSEAIAKGVLEVLIVEAEGVVAGFCAFAACRDEDSMPDDYEIQAIYLDPDCWSRGLGRALWLASRRNMMERGASRVRLWVLADNASAIRFYRAMGFDAEPGPSTILERGGIRLREVRYVYRLH